AAGARRERDCSSGSRRWTARKSAGGSASWPRSWKGSDPSAGLSQRPEEFADVGRQQFRVLGGGGVAAPRDLRPADDVVMAFDKLSRRHRDFLRETRDPAGNSNPLLSSKLDRGFPGLQIQPDR